MKSIKSKGWIYNSLSVILLSAYFFFLSFPLIHTLSHHASNSDQPLECSVENEDDSCHQFVYHNNEDIKCEHDGHFIEYEDHCALCAIITSPAPHYNNTVESIDLTIYTNNELPQLVVLNISNDFCNEDVRGPPDTFI